MSLKWLFKSYWDITLWEISFSASSFSSSLSQEQGSYNDRKEWWRSWACRMAPPRPLCHQGVQQLSIKKPVWLCLSVGLIGIFVFFLSLSWFAVRMGRSVNRKLAIEHQRTKVKEMCKYFPQTGGHGWCWFLWCYKKRLSYRDSLRQKCEVAGSCHWNTCFLYLLSLI